MTRPYPDRFNSRQPRVSDNAAPDPLQPKVQIVPRHVGRIDSAALDPFDEVNFRRDLAALTASPGMFAQYVERARIRFRKASERAVLERWIEFYSAGERLLAAKIGVERRKTEYLQLSREHEIKAMENAASLAKLQADTEEHGLRRDKAIYQREHLERYVEGGSGADISDDEKKLNDAHKRRQLDARWELHESMSALQSLIELQHWRRQRRDQILQDRSLTSQEQGEDLQFVDDLYEQKRKDLRVDARITED